MIVSLSIVLLEDYYSNNIEVLWSRVSFRSIWNDGGMGGYVGELNTYDLCNVWTEPARYKKNCSGCVHHMLNHCGSATRECTPGT
ncbi:MAG: hypothetical protein C5S49_07475 [Candidatus Methanogaster sp.]|nr:MAG: hypothetical protein C5S49_07475 [ANME-2 cluster archaeon]